jgi:cyclophilin family peptidyl-prolyl cis-trans isomerase
MLGGDAHGQRTQTLCSALDSGGDVVIRLARLAPGHVDRIKSLVSRGLLTTVIVFHRVRYPGFMAQGGDPPAPAWAAPAA